jgi:hypothetical protein
LKSFHFWIMLIGLLTPGGPAAAQTPAATQPATTQPAATKPAISPPVVTLLEAGAAPHQPLRLRPEIGVPQAIDMTVSIRSSQTTGGEPMVSQKAPTMRYSMKALVKEIRDNGDFVYEFEYTGVDVVAEEGVDPSMAQMMKHALQMIVGLRGIGVMSDRGFTRSVEFEGRDEMGPVLRQSIESVEQSMQQLVSPFPAEPVGVGASWKVTGAVDQQGITIRQTAILHLAATDGERIEIKVELLHEADPQPLQAPGLPPGASLNIKSYVARGGTEATMRMNRLFPVVSTVAMTSDATLVVDYGVMQQEVVQRTEMTSTMETQ